MSEDTMENGRGDQTEQEQSKTPQEVAPSMVSAAVEAVGGEIATTQAETAGSEELAETKPDNINDMEAESTKEKQALHFFSLQEILDATQESTESDEQKAVLQAIIDQTPVREDTKDVWQKLIMNFAHQSKENDWFQRKNRDMISPGTAVDVVRVLQGDTLTQRYDGSRLDPEDIEDILLGKMKDAEGATTHWESDDAILYFADDELRKNVLKVIEKYRGKLYAAQQYEKFTNHSDEFWMSKLRDE